MTVWTFWWAQAVLIPIVCSVVVSYALEPFVARLQGLRVPRAAAVPVVIGVPSRQSGRARTLSGMKPWCLPTASRRARGPRRARSSPSAATGRVWWPGRSRPPRSSSGRRAQVGAAGDPPLVRIEERPFKWEEWVWQGSRSALVFAAQVGVVLCLVYYLLASGDMFKRKLVRLVGPSLSHKRVTVEILTEIDRQIERFLHRARDHQRRGWRRGVGDVSDARPAAGRHLGSGGSGPVHDSRDWSGRRHCRRHAGRPVADRIARDGSRRWRRDRSDCRGGRQRPCAVAHGRALGQ